MRLPVLISLLIAAPLAIAQTPGSKGDFRPLAGVPFQLWRYTTSMSIPGMPEMPGMAGMPGMRNQTEVCNSEAAASRANWDPSCRITDLGREGLQQRLRMECPDFKGEATMTWAADGRSFRGKFNMKMRDVPEGAAMEIEGVYLRPCSKAEAKM
jgi:hypothetical protein